MTDTQPQHIDTEAVLGALAGIAFAGEDSKVKAAERLRALELLGKYLGLFDGHGSQIEPITLVEDV